MSKHPEGPIGVFDSGVGGLSVLREIRAQLPQEDLLFLADSGHVPYGDKSEAYIRARSHALAGFCLEHGAKAIVVACNTATAAAVASLREHLPVPVVGMEPAVKPAAAASRAGVVGVLATTGTLASARFAALLARFGHDVRVITQPCPGLVEQVEQAALEHPHTRALLEAYVRPLLANGADTLILGCTHYPFLRPLIEQIAGPGIAVIDTGTAVARQLRRVLEAEELLRSHGTGTARFWTSGEPARLQPVIARLWGAPAELEPLPEPYASATALSFA